MNIQNLKRAKEIHEKIESIDLKLQSLEDRKIGDKFDLSYNDKGYTRHVELPSEFGHLAIRVVVADLRGKRRKLELELEKL